MDFGICHSAYLCLVRNAGYTRSPCTTAQLAPTNRHALGFKLIWPNRPVPISRATRFGRLSRCLPLPVYRSPFATTTASAIAVSLGEIACRILRRVPVGEELIHLPNGRHLIDPGIGAGRTSAQCEAQDQTQAGCTSHGVSRDGLARA